MEKYLAKSKPPQSVADHSRHTGSVANALQAVKPAPGINDQAGIIAALHDIGKVNPEFQARIRGKTPPAGLHKNHALVSAAAVNAYLGTGGSSVADIVGAHHGTPVMAPMSDAGGRLGGPDWATARRALIDDLVAEFGPVSDLPTDNLGAAAGLVTVADWVASGAPEINASEAVAAAGFDPVSIESGLSFKDLFGFPQPNVMQTDVAQAVTGPGVYVIESATGSGKTEAALFAAYQLLVTGQATGLYLALPTMATANAMLPRVGRFVKRIAGKGARLLHGQSWTHPAGGGPMAPGGEWFDPAKRGLLYPFAVGTIDQDRGQTKIGVKATVDLSFQTRSIAKSIVTLFPGCAVLPPILSSF
jgi:CRISPR-associated endonuclease/helicase Cas3